MFATGWNVRTVWLVTTYHDRSGVVVVVVVVVVVNACESA